MLALVVTLFQLGLILLKIVVPWSDLSCAVTYDYRSHPGLLTCLTTQLLHDRKKKKIS